MGHVSRWAARVALVAVPAGALIFAAAIHLRGSVIPYDDAFITFRYVEHLVDGKGLVFNEGERVYGFSTVTYLFWLALLQTIAPTVPLPELAVRGNLVPFAAAGAAAFLLVLRITGSRAVAAVAAAAILANPAMLAVSVGGMESFLFVAFVLFCCLAAARDRPLWAGALAALAVLTRLEGIVLLPVLIFAFWRARASLARAAAAFAVPTAGWLAFALAYYGTVVPLPVLAKIKPLYPLAPGWALMTLLSNLETGLASTLLWQSRQLRTVLVIDVLAACSVLCVLHAPFRRRLGWALPLLAWSLLALYFAGNPLVFEWYWPVVFVAALLTIAVGVAAAAALLAERLPRRRPGVPPRLAAAAVFVPALAWLAAATGLGHVNPATGANLPVLKIGEDAVRLRVFGYAQAAEQLNAQLAPGDRVASPEVGSLGYYLKGRVLDASGLVSPEAHAYLPVPIEQMVYADSGAISVDLVRGTLPEWVVTLPRFAAKSLLASEWFRANYTPRPAVRLLKPCWGSDQILIFRRASQTSP